MGKSLRARFNGQAEEVVQYCRDFGPWKTMDKYDCTYIPLLNFLKEMTGDENIGLSPALPGDNGNLLAENLVDAFANRLLKYEDKVSKLQAEVDRLRKELEYRRHQNSLAIEPKIQMFLELAARPE